MIVLARTDSIVMNESVEDQRQEGYPSENLLVKELCCALESDKSPWGKLEIIREFSYGRGRTDVVAVDSEGDVIAFEAKLKKWTCAMHQAYRNTCFAHHSYVVLPEPTVRRAQRGLYEFARRCIGICHIKGDTVVISLPAVRQTPIQPWLSQAASRTVRERNNHEC